MSVPPPPPSPGHRTFPFQLKGRRRKCVPYLPVYSCFSRMTDQRHSNAGNCGRVKSRAQYCAPGITRSCRRQQSRETPIYNWVLPLLWVFGTSFYPCTSSSRSGVKLDCHWRGETQRRRSLSRAHAFRRAEDQCCTYAATRQKMLGLKCKKQNMFF